LAIFQVPNKFFEADGRVVDAAGEGWGGALGGTARGNTPQPWERLHNQKAGAPPPFFIRAGPGARARAAFAFFSEARLCGAGQFLAVRADSLGFAGIRHALLHVRRLRRTRERLAVLADSLALAGILREGRAGGEGGDDGSQEYPLHVRSP